MTFPVTIEKAVACINVARLKRKWFSNVRSRWLLHLVWALAGNLWRNPTTSDHLRLTVAFTQTLKANSLSYGEGVISKEYPRPRKKAFFPFFSFPSHLPEQWCSNSRKGFRCMLSKLLSRICFVARWLTALSWEEGPGEKSFLLCFFMQGCDQICTYAA